MTPEDEAFALMCGREDRNTEYWQDWQDTRPSLHRCKPGRYYRICGKDEE